MKPKNFPGRKYRRQLRANLKVWEMLGIPITWKMRRAAYGNYPDPRIRVGAASRDEHGWPVPQYTGRRADYIVYDDIGDSVQRSYEVMKKEFEAFRLKYPSAAALWKDPNVTP